MNMEFNFSTTITHRIEFGDEGIKEITHRVVVDAGELAMFGADVLYRIAKAGCESATSALQERIDSPPSLEDKPVDPCEYGCATVAPYGWVPAAGCPTHDVQEDDEDDEDDEDISVYHAIVDDGGLREDDEEDDEDDLTKSEVEDIEREYRTMDAYEDKDFGGNDDE